MSEITTRGCRHGRPIATRCRGWRGQCRRYVCVYTPQKATEILPPGSCRSNHRLQRPSRSCVYFSEAGARRPTPPSSFQRHQPGAARLQADHFAGPCDVAL
ncbi:hypothetical protein Ae717Ps2_6790 [Pseudonocardia sp. Ae717_Ps2]|nr:hypothetical protein Ae717Ps2_6790 [Pseudonocardia sp. Ae717_Ps2]